jgi:hypothetical protein
VGVEERAPGRDSDVGATLMPWCKCPRCGQVFHVYPLGGDVEAWFAKMAPDTKPGETPKLLCYLCWKKENPSSDEKSK